MPGKVPGRGGCGRQGADGDAVDRIISKLKGMLSEGVREDSTFRRWFYCLIRNLLHRILTIPHLPIYFLLLISS